jgi:hypothetical protein
MKGTVTELMLTTKSGNSQAASGLLFYQRCPIIMRTFSHVTPDIIVSR